MAAPPAISFPAPSPAELGRLLESATPQLDALGHRSLAALAASLACELARRADTSEPRTDAERALAEFALELQVSGLGRSPMALREPGARRRVTSPLPCPQLPPLAASTLREVTTLRARRGQRVRVAYDFERGIGQLSALGELDAFLVATEDGFSPLGASRADLCEELGLQERELIDLARWNHRANPDVTLVALRSRRRDGRLRGVVLAPCESSRCYERFARHGHGRPFRDFFYNVTYEALAVLCGEWGARRPALSHLSSSGASHEDIATCHAEALVHFCAEQPERAPEALGFVGCCIRPAHFQGIVRHGDEFEATTHRPIRVEREWRAGAELLHLRW